MLKQYLSSTLKSAERVLHVHGLHDSVRKLYRCVKYFLAANFGAPFTISNLVISVGQACNYKCRDCGNFAPYAPAKFRRYSFEDLKNWITLLAQCTDGIHTVQIQGGEPFLYSDLGKVITLLREIRTGGGVELLI